MYVKKTKRTSLTVRLKTLLLNKLRSYSHQKDENMRDLIEDIISKFIIKAERKDGPIRLINHRLKPGPKKAID